MTPRQTCIRSIILLLTMLLVSCASPEAVPPVQWQLQDDGIIVDLAGADFQMLRLQVIDDRIIRVTSTSSNNFSELPNTLMVTADPTSGGFTAFEQDRAVVLETGALSAVVALDSGRVRFEGLDGEVLLEEAGRNLFGGVQQNFIKHGDEGLYGLGQQQDGRVNYANENIELTTHNLEIGIPYLVSTRDYGLLWNNTGISRVGDPQPPQPLSSGFELFDANGEPGGLTVRYFDGEDLLLERQAEDLDYQFLSHANEREVPFPPEAAEAQNLRVTWEGAIVPRDSGRHELKMYSSGYARLSLDGEELLNRWRMNWNPWFHNAWVDMEAGRRYDLALDWTAQGGYFRLLHHGPRPGADKFLSLASETGTAVDYYFVAGESADEVISGYRKLTGKATMLPKWAFGYWQSRERYKSQEELLKNLQTYRDLEIPIDNIVLDWSYWPVDAWGSHDFDPEFFPDPQAMVDRVHELDARIMISIWPKFYPETANYQQLNEAGCMFNKNIEAKNFDWIAPGYLNAFYDAFDANCRDIYWAQINQKLNRLGFDAWWLDAVEPDMHSNLSIERRKEQMTPNALGTGAEYFNAYALPHTETVAAGDRAEDPDIRTFILTRSGFAGIQRTGSAIWSGDIVSRWSNLEEQIAAGIGVGLSGMPYWTMDIGGFTPEDHYRYGESGAVCHYSGMPVEHQRAWQELNLRWFQFGAFTPLFRSHGQNPCREIFNLADEGSEVFESLVWYTNLRYRLMPYIYSLAGDVYHRDGTVMRGLVMDFPDDPGVRDLRTQYLFGPSLMVAPVHEEGAVSRRVYLPAGTDWYDFNSGEKHTGGEWIEAAAPLSRMPLFVREGAIVPTGPAIQHTGEGLNAPLTLNVYTGADGQFEIYEDDGLSYGYERGEWSRIPVTYNDAEGELTIGDRQGRFPGMAGERTISVRWISGTKTNPSALDTSPDQQVIYSGQAITVARHGEARFRQFSYTGDDEVFDLPLADDEFRNPILAGYHPDPSIVRVDDDFYLVNSTFGFFPGIPVFHSRDLVNWTQIGNAIHRPDQLPYEGIHLGQNGVYAPAIEHRDGVFYVINTCVACGGNFVVTATDPAGPWSDPIWTPHIQGIDPSIFFDDDGKTYVVHHGDPPDKRGWEHTALWVMEVDPVTFEALSDDVMLVDGGEEAPWPTEWIEGPHIYKVDGTYYLSAPGGGTGFNHGQLLYRSDNVFGPYEANPDNPVLTQRGLPHDRENPVTATGHGDLFQDGNGDWWIVFLGTRVYDLPTPPQDPGWFHTGRETFMLPVSWEDGWPRVLKNRPVPYVMKRPRLPRSTTAERAMTGNFSRVEEFDEEELGPHWLFVRAPHSQWWNLEDGALKIKARAERVGETAQPSFIGRRLAHMKAEFGTVMDFRPRSTAEEAGLLAIQNDDHFLAFGLGLDPQEGAELRIRRKSGAEDPVHGAIIARTEIERSKNEPVHLRVTIDKAEIDFHYSLDGVHFHALLEDADAGVLTTAKAGGFTGAVIGMYAEGGH